MKQLTLTILLTFVLIACQNQPTVITPPAIDSSPQPTTAPTPSSPPAVNSSNAAVGNPDANTLLAAVAQTMLTVDTLQWEAHITGEFDSPTLQQVINETTTTCSLDLPNDIYCITQELVDATGTVSETPLELLQIGTDQYGRQGDTDWRPIEGISRPRSILLHELFRIQNGQLLFFASEHITTAEITGQETLNGTDTTIVSVEYDTNAYDLYATWYGSETTEPAESQRLTSKLWITPDGRLIQSESRLETAVENNTTLYLTLETHYNQYNQPIELPRP